MSGMNGVSGSASMSRNCGMEGMHAGSKNTQPAKNQHNEETHQNTQVKKIPDQFRGLSIDLKV